jgi:hypothetical protein
VENEAGTDEIAAGREEGFGHQEGKIGPLIIVQVFYIIIGRFRGLSIGKRGKFSIGAIRDQVSGIR